MNVPVLEIPAPMTRATDFIKVAICDDHQLMIDGIKLMISSQDDMQCVGEAHNGLEAIDLVATQPVDILLMDVNMPKMNGIEACKLIVKEHPQIKVISLSMMNELELIKMLAEAGAKGYLLKNSHQEEVLKAIRMVAQDGLYFDQKVFFNSSFGSKSDQRNQQLFPKLSNREKEILNLILQEFTSQEIADQLFIGLGTVETHRRNMISKLGVRNTAGLVRVAVEYRLLEE